MAIVLIQPLPTVPDLSPPLGTGESPLTDLGGSTDPGAASDAIESLSRLDVFHGYIGVFIVSFLVALCMTPVMRWLAVKNGILDRPSDPRKMHRRPVAYLGGVAVFLGLMAGIFFSYIAPALGEPFDELLGFHTTRFAVRGGTIPEPVPMSIVAGMTIIMLLGLTDDVVGTIPRLKIAGMCIAAAALAYEDVGVKVAAGVLSPTLGRLLSNEALVWAFHVPFAPADVQVQFDLIYWTGTAIIALFVLGACNAANLVDGLDGLLSGVTAIAAIGLLIVALTLAMEDAGPRDGQRLVLCMALLGACLGFLPHNFNPATIFLGDAGSLLLGFTTIVIVLTLGDRGQTWLVVSGLVIYAIPIIDTVLAIVRRKLAGTSISAADDQHLHHMLKRALGVKGAVFTLYGIGAAFAALGVLMSLWRARVVYALALIFASYIAVLAIKIARRQQIDAQAARAPTLAIRRFDAGSSPARAPTTGRAPTPTDVPATGTDDPPTR
ncbi:MAG: hypothetical protein H6811_06515 [Phycisphaeraceae bacterium]|nr:hypothetical protein [Phycisphaeraceae bacterium]